jgi:hypothetical protein
MAAGALLQVGHKHAHIMCMQHLLLPNSLKAATMFGLAETVEHGRG